MVKSCQDHNIFRSFSCLRLSLTDGIPILVGWHLKKKSSLIIPIIPKKIFRRSPRRSPPIPSQSLPIRPSGGRQKLRQQRGAGASVEEIGPELGMSLAADKTREVSYF